MRKKLTFLPVLALIGCLGCAETMKESVEKKECASDADCDDKNICIIDNRCSSEGKCIGAIETGRLCNDNNIYTIDDKCNSAGKCAGTPLDCDDNNVCTYDYIGLQGDCVHNTKTAQCQQGYCSGNVFHKPHYCKDKVCTEDGVETCDDGNICTDDFCTSYGCSYKNNSKQCTPGFCNWS